MAAMKKLLSLIVLIGCARQPSPTPVDAASLQAGARTWNNCVSCHVVPDPAIRIDDAWLRSLKTTT